MARSRAVRLVWPLVVVVSSVIAVAVQVVPKLESIRLLCTFWFILICPGMAFTGLMDIGDVLVEIGFGVALSIAVGVLISLAMVYTHQWHPELAVFAEVAIALVGVALTARVALRGSEADRSVT
jgi:uncharacterized membrane protein